MQRAILVPGDLRRNEQGVGHLLVAVGKRISLLLDARIDCAATTAATGLWRIRGRSHWWRGLLRIFNLYIASWTLNNNPAARMHRCDVSRISSFSPFRDSRLTVKPIRTVAPVGPPYS